MTDSTGAAVPNATINIENLATHVSRTIQTNSTGDYAAPSIDPGFNSITVEAQGFTKLVRERVQVEVGNDIKIDFRLKIGSISETVEVKDETRSAKPVTPYSAVSFRIRRSTNSPCRAATSKISSRFIPACSAIMNGSRCRS